MKMLFVFLLVLFSFCIYCGCSETTDSVVAEPVVAEPVVTEPEEPNSPDPTPDPSDTTPPAILHGTVDSGDVVNPASINASGFRFDFTEPVTVTTIKLTDEAGAKLNWIANVTSQIATLTPIAGEELDFDERYIIEIVVEDLAGNVTRKRLFFTTIQKESDNDEREEPEVPEPPLPEPPLPEPPLNDLGACAAGMTLKIGESCSYVAGRANVVFYVKQDGSGCREGGPVKKVEEIFGVKVNIDVDHLDICADKVIDPDNAFNSNFAASKNPDGSWTINRLP